MALTGFTTKKYLESYRRSDTSRIEFLSRDFEDRGRYRDGSANPIAQTWLVSFNYIKTHHALAARYLNLICFLAEKDIPRELFPEENVDTVETDEAIGVLQSYSFITERDDGNSYDIHRLVRLATRNSMDEKEADEYLKIMAEELELQYPYAEHENRHICMRYTPHVEALLSSGRTELDPVLKAELLERVGRSYTQLGKDDIAMKMHEDALELRQKVLGPAHQDTLTSWHSLATMHTTLGKYKQAEHMHRHVLREREKSLGFKHPDTLSSLDDLGNVLHDLGRYKEAERVHVRALCLRQERFGDRHIDTLHSMNNWALVLGALGRHEEAENVHARELEICREIRGPRHPETFNSMNNLALTIRNRGRYKEAEKLFRECLDLRQQELGPKHSNTLNSLNNLALVLGDLEEFEEAEKLHRQELKLCQKMLPPQHPDILISMSNLALILERAGKNDEAQELHQQTEILRKEIEDSNTPGEQNGTDEEDILAMYAEPPATEDNSTENHPTEDNP